MKQIQNFLFKLNALSPAVFDPGNYAEGDLGTHRYIMAFWGFFIPRGNNVEPDMRRFPEPQNFLLQSDKNGIFDPQGGPLYEL